MRTDRLRELADLIEKRSFLFMQSFIGHLGPDPMGDNCGLAGCLADWAYRIYGPGDIDQDTPWRERTLQIGTFAAEALELNDRQAGRLFNKYWPNWWIRVLDLKEKNRIDALGFEPSAHQAARALRKLATIDAIPENERDCPLRKAGRDGEHPA